MFRNRLTEMYEKLDKAREGHLDTLHQMMGQAQDRHSREIAALRDQHREEFARLESVVLDYDVLMLRRIEELKIAHASELSRVIEENTRLRDDVERMRLLATPALASVEVNPDRSAPPAPQKREEVFLGTPWQRIQQREMAKQRAEAAQRLKPVEASASEGGTSNGGISEGRVDAPLGGESKTA